MTCRGALQQTTPLWALQQRASTFVQTFTPLLIRIFHAALTKGATGRVHALRVAASALRMESQCSALLDEANAWIPGDLLSSPARSSSSVAIEAHEGFGTPICARPRRKRVMQIGQRRALPAGDRMAPDGACLTSSAVHASR